MFYLLTNKKFLIGFGVIVFITFIISLILKPSVPLPTILKTIPLNNATGVSYLDPIELKLNSTIDPTLLTITSVPEESWDIKSFPNNVIKAQSKQYLLVNTPYTLNIFYNNEPLSTLRFTTIPQQSEPRANKEVVDEIARDYPLAAKIPYVAPGFVVRYKSPMTFEIELTNSSVERDIIINAVRDWVKENGLDPNSHSYTFAN